MYYHDDKEEVTECFVAYNADEEAQIIALPALGKGKRWHLVCSTIGAVLDEEIVLDNQRTIKLEPREMALYIGK